ncbi:MAG TPA: heme o synthase [Anaerolineales bacterium]|nr:heme o synthase [Anaerolineales bacterium]
MDVKMRESGDAALRLERARIFSGEFLSRLVVLFKLRVVVLLLLASLGGALLASHGSLTPGQIFVLFLTGTLSSAGASAINQYIERDRDGRMTRTCQRPLAVGMFARPETALEVSVVLVILAVMIALPYSMPLAFFLSAGAAVYIWIYTLWLKARTWLNIIIGGAAGSCAVLSGGAAAGNWMDPAVLALALLVFFWTPIHFWSLALAYRGDYARAGVPMLPVVVSARASALWIAFHNALVALIALLMGLHPSLGWYYLIFAAPATLWLGWHSLRLIQTPDRKQALKLFTVSNMYLGFVLVAIYLVTLF